LLAFYGCPLLNACQSQVLQRTHFKSNKEHSFKDDASFTDSEQENYNLNYANGEQ